MNKEITQHCYKVNLPLDEAISFRGEIEEMILTIAKEKGYEDSLVEADFHISASQPSITAGTVITIVVTYLGTKILEKTLDKVIDKSIDEIWAYILKEIKRRYGERILEEEKNSEEN